MAYDKDEIQRRYADARKMIASGRKTLAEGHALLREILGQITHARTRGQVNNQIWLCERALGKRDAYFSQSGQDAWLDERVFKGKRNGVFVEVGGYDGFTGSNCLFFEMQRGWTGLMIEPSPTYFARAEAFRRATCLQLAVSDAEGEAEFLEIQEGFSQMSGLTSSYDADILRQVEADPRHKGEVIRVQTRTLPQIFDEHGLREIDYVSLDVEGGEHAILSSFPFDTYRVHAWTVENNTGDTEIPALMKDKGYARAEALGVDDIYVLKDA